MMRLSCNVGVIHELPLRTVTRTFSTTNYLYTMLKKDRPFPKKYIEWRKGLDVETHNVLKRRQYSKRH